MEKAYQARFVPDASNSEFIEGKPVPTDCDIRMILDTEIFVVKSEITREMIKKTKEKIEKSQDDFYKANPHLHGNNAYYSWLAQASDY